jgi:hypothetical protein
MSALGTIIEHAVSTVIAEHPKLFEAKSIERAQKLLSREIMKSLTRDPRGDGDAAATETAPEPYERITASDERGIAYCNLRIAARALAAPTRLAGGDLYLPLEASGPEVQPFAKMPPRDQWLFVTDLPQMTAWREFFDATLPTLARRPFGEVVGGDTGVWVPWPWPPSKTGKVYEPETESEDAEVGEVSDA